MSKTIPNYLRLHRGPKRQDDAVVASSNPIDQFWNVYSEVTGWRFDAKESSGGSSPSGVARDGADASSEADASSFTLRPAYASDSMMTAADMEDVSAVSESSASRLAAAANELAGHLKQSQQALRHQEVELAARAAVVAGSDRLGKLADRLGAVLSDACTATGCVAAAVYMLDDETRFLKTRFVHGLPHERLTEPPRELKLCRGDLEAFVQGTVLINALDSGPLDTWHAPEGFPAAICVGLTQNDLPIGSVWFFADQVSDFGDRDAAVGRLAAGQVSALLTTAAEQPQVEIAPVEKDFAIEDVAAWQFRLLPSHQELATGWHVDGMVESPVDWTVGWHYWDILPDGSLMMAIAEAEETSLGGAMHASVARAALAAHTGYRHTPNQIMQRINDTLWQTNSGDQLVSLLYARIDPETGEGEMASAGSISAMIASKYGYRPLVSGDSDPLASHIDGRCKTTDFRLTPGEALLAFTAGVSAPCGGGRRTPTASATEWTLAGSRGGFDMDNQSDGRNRVSSRPNDSIRNSRAVGHDLGAASQMVVGEAARSAMRRGSTSPLASLRRALAEYPMNCRERAAVSLVRSTTVAPPTAGPSNVPSPPTSGPAKT